MPHVIVKLYPGRTAEQKHRLTDEIVKSVVAVAGCGEDAVSVAFEEVEPASWLERVYRPDILETTAEITKKPGYRPEP